MPTCPRQPVAFHSTKLSSGMKDDKKIETNEVIVTPILESIQELAQLLSSRGIDLSNGKMPSMIQVSRIAYDEEVTAKFKSVSLQFHEAGIEFDLKTAQKYLKIANSKQAIDNK
ncbi:7363_t:CDS:1 [Cetraspora pellucida]|uniref:7363_t:CDS:1 n=1 Tax=Cetraspora pellucida TaxID=1433469 RepID=A0A9N9HF41_9GLOM|nr:7363_t:CDS:1 [Cetraspora pellucida]